MRNARIFLSLGIWAAILPFLGLPYSWKDILFTLTGLLIVYLSYSIYRKEKPSTSSKNFDNFRDNIYENEPQEQQSEL